MTTIAFRDGIIAADSRTTTDTEAGGTRVFTCQKLYPKKVKLDGLEEDVILATAGESAPGELFTEWFGTGKDVSDMRDTFVLGQADFTVLVLKTDGLYEVDMYCHLTRILDKFYAVGSGAKAAMGAMFAGADARRAVEIACKIDPYSAPPIVTMSLPRYAPAHKPRKRRLKVVSTPLSPSDPASMVV
jgi:ATP-dependent protease HslVU (ClpYQ) peptidase subunit